MQSPSPPTRGPPTGTPLDNVFVKLDHRTINLHGLTTTSTIQDVYDKLKEETKISQANTGLIFGSKELRPGLGESPRFSPRLFTFSGLGLSVAAKGSSGSTVG